MASPTIRALSFAAVLCAIGCRDSTGPKRVVAIYRLQTVNGVPLPDVKQVTPTRVELIARTLTLYLNRSVVDSSEYREVTGSGTILSSSSLWGRWEQSGARIDLVYELDEFFAVFVQCDVNGDLMTCFAFWGEDTWVYRKDTPGAG